jgi:FixJ family two-component response regulator
MTKKADLPTKDKSKDVALKSITIADKEMSQRCLRGRIVLIDDDPEIVSALKSLLDMEGYACETYLSANEFLKEQSLNKLKFPGPWCILCDVKMPEVDGLELQRQLINLGAPPLVLMSGASGASEAVEGLRAGALDFLIKPFDADTLLATLQRALIISSQRQLDTTKTFDLNERISLLSKREFDIINRVLKGQINRDIAEEEAIALRTVKHYRHLAFKKLGVTKLVDLVRLFEQNKA